MRKIVFCFIVLLLPLILVAATIDISANGLRGSGGALDNTAVYGETVSVTIRFSTTNMATIDGTYCAVNNYPFTTYDDEVMVHYYDGQDPGTSNYLGFMHVSINNFNVQGSLPVTSCTFDFTLPTWSGNTAYSFQISCGLIGNNTNDPPVVERLGLCSSYINVPGTFNIISTGSIAFWFDYLDNNGNPLPVTLSSFTASFVDDTPTLYWTTQSETNNNGWNVYRSISQNIGQAMPLNVDLVPGQGTTSEPTNYQFYDNHGVEENTTYWYWIESIDFSGETELFGPISLLIPLGGGNFGTPATPDDYGLHQNYPNPFNPSTVIKFALKEASYGELTIYNIKGKKIKTIFSGNIEADKVELYPWDGKDESGRNVASGIYLYQLRTKHDVYMKKMVLTK